MHEALFNGQDEWTGSADAVPIFKAWPVT